MTRRPGPCLPVRLSPSFDCSRPPTARLPRGSRGPSLGRPVGAAQLRPRLAAASGRIAQGPPAPPRGSGVPAAPLRGPVAPRVASGTESALSKRLPAQGPGRAPLGTLLLTPLTAGTSPPGASGRETAQISGQAALYQVTRTGRPTRAGLAAVISGDRVSHTRTGNTAPPGGPAEARSPPPAEAPAATSRFCLGNDSPRRLLSTLRHRPCPDPALPTCLHCLGVSTGPWACGGSPL